MKELQSGYGFLSTYEETVFLKQEMAPDGTWEVWVSPIIDSTTIYIRSGTTTQVSLRQCMFHVSESAASLGAVANQTPASQWVPPFVNLTIPVQQICQQENVPQASPD